jgi:hypothetical protein
MLDPAEQSPTAPSIDPRGAALAPEDVFPDARPRAQRRRSFLTLPVTFCLGVAATISWYSFGGPVREALAGMPQFSWMEQQLQQQLSWLSASPPATAVPAADPVAAPPPAASSPALDQQLNATAQDLDAVRQDVERIATAQDQIIRTISQLTAGQEQLTKEIAKVQATEQYILYKNSEAPPARPAPAPVRRTAPAPGPAPAAAAAPQAR